MSDKRLGVCIVGAGDMGTQHAARWSQLAEAQVVAIVDIIPERAEKLARSHQLDKGYSDYRHAVSLPAVDVVSVCVPTCSHPEITIFAANQGKHVLCEKPIALTLPEAAAMTEATGQNGVKLGLGFMRRYSSVTVELREHLTRGELGRPVMYHSTDIREIRPKLEMHDQDANGGPVIDMGVHLFDGWNYMFDSQPEVVFAQGLKLARDRAELAHIDRLAYDTATVSVRYASGDVGTWAVTWGLPPTVQTGGRPDQIFGPRGLVQVEYGIRHQKAQLIRAGGEAEVISESDQDMYQLEIADFARCVLEDRPPRTSGSEAKAALEVALAALESIQTGQRIQLV